MVGSVCVPGNAQSLKEDPKEKKINVYKELRAFWKRYYSAHYMTLAVQSIGQPPSGQRNRLQSYALP